MPKLKVHQVGQAGEHFVAAELHRRGAYAVTFSGNMPNIDILSEFVWIRWGALPDVAPLLRVLVALGVVNHGQRLGAVGLAVIGSM